VTEVVANAQNAGVETTIRNVSYAAFLVFLWGTIAFMWGANLVAHRRPGK